MNSVIGSGNGLVPSGSKPLLEPMLTQMFVAIWCHLVAMGAADDWPYACFLSVRCICMSNWVLIRMIIMYYYTCPRIQLLIYIIFHCFSFVLWFTFIWLGYFIFKVIFHNKSVCKCLCLSCRWLLPSKINCIWFLLIFIHITLLKIQWYQYHICYEIITRTTAGITSK